MAPNYLAENGDPEKLDKLFKMTANLSMKNMVGFNKARRL